MFSSTMETRISHEGTTQSQPKSASGETMSCTRMSRQSPTRKPTGFLVGGAQHRPLALRRPQPTAALSIGKYGIDNIRPFDRLQLLLAGDIEANPGPNTPPQPNPQPNTTHQPYPAQNIPLPSCYCAVCHNAIRKGSQRYECKHPGCKAACHQKRECSRRKTRVREASKVEWRCPVHQAPHPLSPSNPLQLPHPPLPHLPLPSPHCQYHYSHNPTPQNPPPNKPLPVLWIRTSAPNARVISERTQTASHAKRRAARRYVTKS